VGKRKAPRSAARFAGHPVHEEILRLQATAGNRAVAHAVKASKPPTGSTEFQDCPADWKPQAKAAASLSKQWLPAVITGLYNMPQPVPYPIRSYISLYFSTTKRSDLQHIAYNLAQVLGGLTGNIYFQCEHAGGMCSSASAYMYVLGRDVHLCPSWFHNQDGPEKAATVIHELAHLRFGADDIAYDGDKAFHKLPPDKAMNNADTYSEFVQATHGMF
jgi:Lysine-specific metallo-endopeptidase